MYTTSYRSNNRFAQPPAPKKHRRRRLLWPLIILFLVIGGLHLYNPFEPHGDADKKASAVVLPVLPPTLVSQMSSQINSAISNYPNMQVGVAIEDLNNGARYHFGLSEPFVAASVSKVLTATMYLKQVENGKYTLTQSLGGYPAQYEIQQMIEQSDNTAWNNLNTLLTHAGLESYAQSIGLTNYDPDQNTLTVDDISLLLSKIYSEKLLNHADTQLLLSYMHDADYADYIPASIPAGVTVYHKAGWLDDRVHDAAIIDNGKHPYVLVIFTKTADGSEYPTDEGHQIFADITTATTKVFL